MQRPWTWSRQEAVAAILWDPPRIRDDLHGTAHSRSMHVTAGAIMTARHRHVLGWWIRGVSRRSGRRRFDAMSGQWPPDPHGYPQPYGEPGSGYPPGQQGYPAPGSGPPPPVRPYGPPPGYGVPVPPVSAMAITSLVTGVVCLLLSMFSCGFLSFFSILPVIFGHLALRETRREGKSGNGMAIAGLALGYLGVATTLILIVYGVVLLSA